MGKARDPAGRVRDHPCRTEQQYANLYTFMGKPRGARKPRGRVFNDPEWLEKRAKSEANGPLVDRIENSLLTPTAYSSLR